MSANIIAYTDGSFRRELHIGGWSAVLIKDNKISEYSKRGFATDVNVVELKAIILALENTPVNSNVTIYSDAKSLIDVIQSRILSNENNIPSKNEDLWQNVKELTRTRNVSCAWIKGHSGIEGNVRANELAYQALFEFKDHPYDRVIEELLFVKIPTKYKDKKLLFKRFRNALKILK
jgi:ribonuclease HI